MSSDIHLSGTDLKLKGNIVSIKDAYKFDVRSVDEVKLGKSSVYFDSDHFLYQTSESINLNLGTDDKNGEVTVKGNKGRSSIKIDGAQSRLEIGGSEDGIITIKDSEENVILHISSSQGSANMILQDAEGENKISLSVNNGISINVDGEVSIGDIGSLEEEISDIKDRLNDIEQ